MKKLHVSQAIVLALTTTFLTTACEQEYSIGKSRKFHGNGVDIYYNEEDEPIVELDPNDDDEPGEVNPPAPPAQPSPQPVVTPTAPATASPRPVVTPSAGPQPVVTPTAPATASPLPVVTPTSTPTPAPTPSQGPGTDVGVTPPPLPEPTQVPSPMPEPTQAPSPSPLPPPPPAPSEEEPVVPDHGGGGVPTPTPPPVACEDSILIHVKAIDVFLESNSKSSKNSKSSSSSNSMKPSYTINKDLYVDLVKLEKNDILTSLGIHQELIGKSVKQIRLITADSGHVVKRGCVQVCRGGVKIPSGNTSGIKFHLEGCGLPAVDVNASTVLNLRIKKLSHSTGNGMCIIHPEYKMHLKEQR